MRPGLRLLFFSLLLSRAHAVETFAPWLKTNSGGVSKVEWAGDRWLVFQESLIQSSVDGVNWSIVFNQVPGAKGTSLLDGRIVAGATTVATSHNGINWVSREKADFSFPLTSQACNGSLIVGIGSWPTPRRVTTTDGLVWSAPVEDPELGVSSIVWSGTSFVTVGAKIETSSDGYSWTPRTWGGRELRDVTEKEGGKLLAVGLQGQAAISTDDGQSWMAIETSLTGDLTAVAGHPGSYVAIMGGRLCHSTDGITWSQPDPSVPFASFQDVGWNGSRFVAAGDQSIFSSTDGLNWTGIATGTLASLSDVAAGPPGAVAVGDGVIMMTANGVDWRVVPEAAGVLWSRVTWCGDRYVVTSSTRKIATSMDGVTWDIRELPEAAAYRGVAWNGTRAVIGGERGGIWSSTNFQGWTPSNAGVPADFYPGDVIWTGTSFIAFPGSLPDGRTLRSVDGITWTAGGSTVERPGGAAVGNGAIVALSSMGPRATSTDDGLTWTPGISGQPGADGIDVIWDGSRFVMIDGRKTICISQNGTDWERIGNSSREYINSLTMVGERYVGAGYFGMTFVGDEGLWPTASAADVTAAENGAGAKVVVTLSHASGEETRVSYTTRADSATGNADYADSSGQIVIPAGQLQGSVTVPFIDDAVFEGAESFFVDLLSIEGGEGAFLATGSVKISITDNEVAYVSIDSVTVNEWAGSTSVRVHCEDARAVPIRMMFAYPPLSFIGATPGADFTAPPTIFTMLPEQNEIFIPIIIRDDYISEPDEGFYVELSIAAPDGVKKKPSTFDSYVTIIDGGPGFDGAMIAQGLIPNYGFSRPTPDVDSDKDGLANLTAFGFGVPIKGGFVNEARSYLPSARISPTGDHLQLRASLPDPLPIGVRCDVEESGDGLTWTRTASLTRNGGWQNLGGISIQQGELQNGRRETLAGSSHTLAEAPLGLMRLKWALLTPQ